MAQPQLLQDNFTRMVQDLPRDQLPDDAAWYMRDWIPNAGLEAGGGQYPGRLSRRSGWLYSSENVATDATSAVSITAMSYFEAFNRLTLMTDNNKFGYITLPGSSSADYTNVSTAGVQSRQNFVEIAGKQIITASDGTTAPKYYDGTTFGALAGSPPAGQFATAWKDRLVLGNSSANKNRSWFSGLDDPTTWDTTNGWLNTVAEITGYAALPNALLIFGSDRTARVRGSIPPPGSDFIVDDPIFHVGCTYPMSIAVNGPTAAFCNEEGVWLTNGTNQPQDLTALCGVKSTWQKVTTAATRIPEVSIGNAVEMVAGGFIGNYYLASVKRTSESPTSTIAFLFNLAERSCVLLQNFPANCMAMTPQVGDELFMGPTITGTVRVVALSPIFWPGGQKEDADGTDITPVLYTRYYSDNRVGQKRWKTAYLDYYMKDAASDNPTLTVSYDPREYGNEIIGGETSIGTLAETTSTAPAYRAKLPIRYASRGVSFKISQTNPSAATNIIALLADVHAREGGRVG